MKNDNIDLSKLTPAQLAALRQSIKALAKARTGDATKRNGIIDPMLKPNAKGEFRFTTADILAQLQLEKVVPANLTQDERAAQLKIIQSRKQKLTKAHPDQQFGYKPTPLGTKAIDLDAVIAWLAGASEADRDAVQEALDTAGDV